MKSSRDYIAFVILDACETPSFTTSRKSVEYHHAENEHYTPMLWEHVIYHIIHSSMHQDESKCEKYFASRTKQWLGYLKRQYPQANALFDEIRRLKAKDEVADVLRKYAKAPSIDTNHN